MTTPDWINLAIAVATTLSVLVSLAVAVVTYKTVQANRAAVDVMKAQLEATTRPHILVGVVVRPMSTFMQLRISNTGASSAKRLRLTLDKDYFFNAEENPSQNLRTYSAFTQEIAEFPPQAELLFHLGVGHRILQSDRSPTQFTVSASYEYAGRSASETSSIDLRPYGNSGKPIDPTAERLEGIQSELKAIGAALNRDAA
jgi:hypothetical protein